MFDYEDDESIKRILIGIKSELRFIGYFISLLSITIFWHFFIH